MECINNLDRVYVFISCVENEEALLRAEIDKFYKRRLELNSFKHLINISVNVIFSSMNCNQNDNFLMLFTSLLITFFLVLFPLLQSEWKCWWESFYTSCLPLLATSPQLCSRPLIVPFLFHTHARSSVLWWWILAVTSNKHSEKLHYHFKGCLSIRELTHLLPSSGRGYLCLVMVGKENWPPVPNFMWNFFSEIGAVTLPEGSKYM